MDRETVCFLAEYMSMSNVDVKVLDEYSSEEIEGFNKYIEGYLESSEGNNEEKKAVAYFYLLAHKLEDKRESVGSFYVQDKLRIMVGKTLTVIDAAITDPKQNKATKDIIKQEYYRLCSAVSLELQEDEKPIPMPEERESDIFN